MTPLLVCFDCDRRITRDPATRQLITLIDRLPRCFGRAGHRAGHRTVETAVRAERKADRMTATCAIPQDECEEAAEAGRCPSCGATRICPDCTEFPCHPQCVSGGGL